MQHVDESLLTAYADGALPDAARASVEAHLVACAVCRARVDEERGLAARSAAILAHAAPDAQAVPPFESVVRRSTGAGGEARETAGRRARRRGGWMPLAWAASLIVALGAGWIARMMLRSPAFDARVEQESAGSAAPVAAPTAAGRGADAGAAAGVGPARTAIEADRDADVPPAAAAPADAGARAATVPAPAGRAAPQEAPRAMPEPRELRSRAAADARAEPDVQPKAAGVEPEVVAVAAAPPPPPPAAQADVAAAPGTGVIAGRLVDAATGTPLAGAQVTIDGTAHGTVTDPDGRFRLDAVAPGMQSVRLQHIGYAASIRPVSVHGDSSSTLSVALAPAAVALESLVVTGAAERAESARVARQPADDRAVDPSAAAWRGTSADARGAVFPRIAALPVDSVWIAAAEAPWAARVVQRIDGAPVELIEWRAGAPAVSPANGTLSDGRGYVTTVIDGAVVELRAFLAPVRLERLAATLRRPPVR